MKNIFKGKVVLITGGTGFLGRHLVREILKYEPQSIRIFSRDEVKHHLVAEEFKDHLLLIRNFIGDVRDYERLKTAMRGVDIVIHAAALKRLDILEYNVEESVKTNILGTLNVVKAALEYDVEKAVFVSTDKACSPVNTYGACKFVSERIFTESNFSKGDARTVFTVVRYGNVLESTGSVIPFFTEKILSGHPIPLTDPRMTRFIISPKQAVQLIFDALRYSVGGEIFVPRLHAFKITDLIGILKNKYDAKNDIEIIGLRPGEKIHELMVNASEVSRTFGFKGMYVITSQIQKYQDYIAKPKYVNPKNKLSERVMPEYSSEDEIIPPDQVETIFKKYGLIS